MPIRVEFFGVARQRAGLSQLTVPLIDDSATLGDVLTLVVAAVPGLGGKEFVDEGRLHPSLSANLDGEQFVSDPATLVRGGQSLLILSADAGG
ncbi:MAG: MoaD/ThiS family protein [Pirellulaceae bacterium]